MRHPSERRPGQASENIFVFWPRHFWNRLTVHVHLARLIASLALQARAIQRSSNAVDYMDQALMPVGADDDETLDLLTETAGASSAIAHTKKIARLTGGQGLGSAL
jgi:hypothetical protein